MGVKAVCQDEAEQAHADCCTGALLDNAKAHLALKTSLLFEKETLIASTQKNASDAEKGKGGSRLWNIFGRRSSANPQPERQTTWREL